MQGASISGASLLQEKIASPELLEVAESGSDQLVSVLIQLDLPPRRVTVAKGRKDVMAYAFTGVEPVAAPEQEMIERRVAEAHSFLEGLLGTPPRWLGSSRSFVASVTPVQLRAIALSTTTKAIWPNRQWTKTTHHDK